MDDPRAVVRAFIADYFRWNQDSWRRDEPLMRRRGPGGEEARFQAVEQNKREYAALLAGYCRPGFEGQSIAYGSSSSHDPEGEVIVSGKPRGDRCTVRTRMTEKIAQIEMATDYEYRLTRSEGRWYLESVKAVLEDGKFECL